MEEFQRDVKQYGLKTLEHSRWADKEEPKDETLCKTPASCIDADNSDWRAGGYGVPGLKMDMEAFRLEVKEHGLKTLQDSRWAK
ncbi:hypothetical protein F5Y10DRAFT_257898 [Nemania abortiva]|nr:hypothetical protein F5Y10DRAFT_257898 [Nemania abortiva]